MKYSNDVVINAPRAEVIRLFDSAENMKYWQKGLVSCEVISGKSGEVGSKSELKYRMGKRGVEMIETITEKNPPEEFHANYETKGIFNIQKNFFTEEGGKTRWTSESEFQCSGFMKVISFFFGKSTFKKQSQVYMDDFKSFAEGDPKYGI